jgi:hypothetical protein
VTLNVECDRAWDQRVPEDCEVVRGREMHLLAGYAPADGERVQIDVARTVAPIVLVLSSYADVTWELRVAEGVELHRVYTVGRGNAQVEGTPPGVQVQARRDFPIMGWDWENEMVGSRTDWTGRDTAERAERELEQPLRAFAGCYNPTRFVLGQGAPR